MPRTSLAQDLFNAACKAPWWLGVTLAGLVFLAGYIFLGHAPASTPTAAFHKIIRFFINGLAILCLVGAAISAIKQLFRRNLLNHQQDLVSLRSLSWRQFEQLVGEAYRRQGYDVEETGQGGADGGIDLVLRGNGETVLVQCKQWRVQQVGVDKVRELFGVLTSEGANRAILVTSGSFTNEAKSFKVGKPLTLVDGPALATLVRSVQPSPAQPLNREPKTVNREPQNPEPQNPEPSQPTCPQCGAPMTLCTAKRGANAGTQFYGCTRYPACKAIRNA